MTAARMIDRRPPPGWFGRWDYDEADDRFVDTVADEVVTLERDGGYWMVVHDGFRIRTGFTTWSSAARWYYAAGDAALRFTDAEHAMAGR